MNNKKTLEDALADMEASIAKTAELQERQFTELEADTTKQNALNLRLAALSQSQRRQVLNDAGLRHISAAPSPITPLKGSSYRPPIKRPFEQPIDWRYWRHMPEVKQWEACALSLNIDPLNLKHSSKALMPGVGSAPKFSLGNFPSETLQTEFDKRLRLLGASLFKSGYFTTINKLAMGGRHLATISLDQFARWGLHVELEMPSELVALASGQQPKQSETAFEKTEELNAMRMPGDGGMSFRRQWLSTEAAKDAPEPVRETTNTVVTTLPDAERRLTLLRHLGGSVKFANYEWKFTGIKKLVQSEVGKPRSSEKTIRADLIEAANQEREAKKAGFADGLGSRN